jgi:uncharacterized membrane protein
MSSRRIKTGSSLRDGEDCGALAVRSGERESGVRFRDVRGPVGVKFETGTDRLEIFSDAVIAIAITLLVLDIKVPHSRDGHLVHDLLQQWPFYLAYVHSFAVIGIMWVSHHSMFERIHHADRVLLFMNLWLLLGIAFLPFPTALLAEYGRQGGSNSHAAAAVYSTTMTLIGFAFLSIWVHLAHRPALLDNKASAANLRRSINLSLVSPVVYGLSIGLALVSTEACFVVFGLAALYFAFGPSSRALSRRLEHLFEVPADPSTTDALRATDRGGADGHPTDGAATGVDVAEVDAGPRAASKTSDPDPSRHDATDPTDPGHPVQPTDILRPRPPSQP